MKIDRKVLDMEIHSILIDINNKKKQKDEIAEIIKDRHGFTVGEVKKMLNGTVQLTFWSLTELCIFTIVLFEILKEEKINPEKFFNPPEIINARRFKKEIKTKENRLIFENVEQIADRQWVCPKRSFHQIADDMNNHRVTYNFETQRDAIIQEYKDKMVKIPNTIKPKVVAIKNEIINGTFTSNLITYNILRTGQENFHYDEKTKTLIVEIDQDYTEVNVIDGANRQFSITELIEEKPTIIGNMIISILNYDVPEAQHYIRQEQQAAPISKELEEKYNNNDFNMMIAKDINSYGNIMKNEMHNKVALNKDELIKENKYTTFHVIKESISQNFKFNNQHEANKVKEHIISVLNYIFGYFRDKFGDLDKVKEKYIILMPNAFYGYITLAGETFNNPDWELEIINVLKDLDFSKFNPTWKEVAIDVDNIKKSDAKKLSKLFSLKVGV